MDTRGKIKKIIYIGLILYAVCIRIDQYKINKSIDERKEKAREEIQQLEEEIMVVRSYLNKGDLEFVEKIAREERGMIRPREIMYIDDNKEEKSLFR